MINLWQNLTAIPILIVNYVVENHTFLYFYQLYIGILKKSSRVSTYIIDYQGLNSSVIITTYIVVVVKYIQGSCR